ncbi:hypothetical protein QS257_09625 [Terrilactibacillus sp. S3-3]|nr:hypothetical protein QS257_09625 [Terrilactibacillus sp. S3-3]
MMLNTLQKGQSIRYGKVVGQMKIKPIKNMVAYFTATVKGTFERIFHDELNEILNS